MLRPSVVRLAPLPASQLAKAGAVALEAHASQMRVSARARPGAEPPLRALLTPTSPPPVLRTAPEKGIVSTKQDETTLTQASVPQRLSPLPSQLAADAHLHPTHASGIASGAPPALTHRTVRIYRPTPSTMQSGKAGYNHWRLDFDTLAGGGRWINPLMGWASS
jgi:NADH dehydrogenase (ubiquinone) Fe-S protein 4